MIAVGVVAAIIIGALLGGTASHQLGRALERRKR